MKSPFYSKPRVLINCKATLGEGPFWNYKTFEFGFVDISEKKFFIWKKNILKTYNVPFKISCIIPTKKKNSWIARSKNGVDSNIWVCIISNKAQNEWSSVSDAGYFKSLEWGLVYSIIKLTLLLRFFLREKVI